MARKTISIWYPSIPDEFKNFPIWKTVLCLVGCGLILIFVIPPIYLLMIIVEKYLMRRGTIHKGMNYGKVFSGL